MIDIDEIEVLAPVGWKPEDELPYWIVGEVYDELFPSSVVPAPGGVRWFPYISLFGKEIYLITTTPPK